MFTWDAWPPSTRIWSFIVPLHIAQEKVIIILGVFDKHRPLHRHGIGRGKLCPRGAAVPEPRRLNTLTFEDDQRRCSNPRGVDGCGDRL